MRKLISLLAVTALALFQTARSQTVYDAIHAVDDDLSGTARYVGMAGAMNALGGDISTISVNPAGIGVFRSSEASLTGGLTVHSNRNQSLDGTFNHRRTRGDFDQIGFVFSSRIGSQTRLRYLNFGFNYHRAKDFTRVNQFSGNLGKISQTFYMADQADGITSWGEKPYLDDNIGWLSILGYDSYLLCPGKEEGQWVGMYNGGNGRAYSRESGALDVFDFNVSMNFTDRFYLGFSIGAYDLHYSKYLQYSEAYTGQNEGEGYDLASTNRLRGMGVDFKAGAIFRPIEDSPFRVGLAIHTPTFYELTYRTRAAISSDVYDVDYDEVLHHNVSTWDQLGNKDMERRFQMSTPWLFNVSAGTTIGSNAALDVEYQFQDFSCIKFRDIDGYSDIFSFENSTTAMLKGVHQIKAGAEFKPVPELALRVGYNFRSAYFKSDAYKDLPYYSINTDTDFLNSKRTHTFTAGIGYRSGYFYADLAYRHSVYRSDYYPFLNRLDNQIWSTNSTRSRNIRGQVLVTLGLRM